MGTRKNVMGKPDTQDSQPGERPFGSGDIHHICREYEITDENGRHLGILRTVVLRSEVKRTLEDRWFFASIHAVDERKL